MRLAFREVKARKAFRCTGAGASYPGRHGSLGLDIPAGEPSAVAVQAVGYGGAAYSRGCRLCLECSEVVQPGWRKAVAYRREVRAELECWAEEADTRAAKPGLSDYTRDAALRAARALWRARREAPGD